MNMNIHLVHLDILDSFDILHIEHAAFFPWNSNPAVALFCLFLMKNNRSKYIKKYIIQVQNVFYYHSNILLII